MHASASPRAPQQPGRLPATPPEGVAATWARAILSQPSKIATVFWAGGVVATVSVLPLVHWSHPSTLALVIIAGACATGCGVRVAAGARLPRWTLHVDVGVATVAASVLAAVGATGHVPFADLYTWVTIFAALYFRPLLAIAHVVAAAASYAVVLAVGPTVPSPVAAWLALFGTLAVAAIVVIGLVSVLRRAGREDPLTGLANRRSFDERLEEELKRAQRTGTPLSAVIIDLDRFKAINDAGGHESGDHLLRALANAWQEAIRGGGDFLARTGGDEFSLLAPGADAMSVRRLVKRLADALPAGITASIGVATWDRAENAADLLRRADQAMYQTKQRRKGPPQRLNDTAPGPGGEWVRRALWVLAPRRLVHVDAVRQCAPTGCRLVAVGYASGRKAVLQGGVCPGADRFRVRGSGRRGFGSIV